MVRSRAYREAREQIRNETDAEFAFGRILEQSGIECDDFMTQWNISQAQFNTISHYVYGLTDSADGLPPAVAALLVASRTRRAA